jgi:hypothetical protein
MVVMLAGLKEHLLADLSDQKLVDLMAEWWEAY